MYSWQGVCLPRICGFSTIYVNGVFYVYLLFAIMCENKVKHMLFNLYTFT